MEKLISSVDEYLQRISENSFNIAGFDVNYEYYRGVPNEEFELIPCG